MKMKGHRVTEKLNKLQRRDGGLNEFIRMQNEKQKMNINVSRDDQNQLVKAIEGVDSLKTQVKLQMASVKVVDLKKKRENQAKALEEEKMAQGSAFKRL